MKPEKIPLQASLLSEASLLNVVSLARTAGEAIMAVYREKEFGTTYKDDHSPLTRADLAAHDLIVHGLKTLTPDLPTLSEESAIVDYEVRQNWPCYWLIDPLDGTKEFLKRNDEFCVNIALIQNGIPVLGVVYAPVFDVMYYAAEGLGGFKKEKNGEAQRLSVFDYRNRRLTITISRSHITASLETFLKKMGAHNVVLMGSALKLCLVAEGAADLYPRFGRTMEWDTAAGHAIVTAAGGSVSNAQGISLFYNKPDLANPDFFVRGAPPVPIETVLET